MSVITEKKAFEKAIPIIVTDRRRAPKLIESLSPAERRWVQAAAFAGAPDTQVLVPDTKGNIASVIAGVRDAGDPWALAALPMSLPRARYALAKSSLNVAPENAAFAWDLGGYQFTRYRKARRKPADLQLEGGKRVTEALGMAAAVRLVRDLV